MDGKKLFVFGIGYSGTKIAKLFHSKGYEIAGTVRTVEAATELVQSYPNVFHVVGPSKNVYVFGDGKWNDEFNEQTVEEALLGTTHLVISVPTGRSDGQEDIVLSALREQLISSIQPTIQWVGYLSTIGVYGETNGLAVDESAPVQSSVRRSQLRIVAEKLWLDTGLPVHIFRLAGIYGPGRGPLAKIRSGSASRIKLPGRMFNRIHVDDIANIVWASAMQPNARAIYNVCDDEPAAASDVIAYGCELLGLPVIPEQSWEEAEENMSAMAKTFYAESKLVLNNRVKDELDVKLLYPTYKEGMLAQILEEENMNNSPLSEENGNVESISGAFNTNSPYVILVNIGSLSPSPFLDLRQISFRLSRSLRLPVIPCSFRFSDRIDPSRLNGTPAKSLQKILEEYFNQIWQRLTSTDIVILPLFFGESGTLTETLPKTLTHAWNSLSDHKQNGILQVANYKIGRCLVDLQQPQDDRVAKILYERIQAVQLTCPAEKSITVIVLDHGTPTKQVHYARELVTKQVQSLVDKESSTNTISMIERVVSASMERREGPEYEFNDPLLENAIEYHNITSDIIIVALLFLSNGRHAGPEGDIAQILDGVREVKSNKVDVRMTEPLGSDDLLTNILADRYRQALTKEKADYIFSTK